MGKNVLCIGSSIINTQDIVEIEEKQINFTISKQKPNPKPKPAGFFAKLVYSETISYYEEESYFCIVLKVKGGVQTRGRVDANGNVSVQQNQLYNFYAVCNDLNLINRIQQDIDNESTEKVREIGNYHIYFGVLRYPDYLKTNVLVDRSINSKADFIHKYL